MNIASPNDSIRYSLSMACLYARMMLSRLLKALTSIINVLRGTWKFVIRQSTTWNVLPGSRNRFVRAWSRAFRQPASSSQAL